MDDHIKNFLSSVQRLESLYQSIKVRVIACGGNVQAKNILTHILLDFSPQSQQSERDIPVKISPNKQLHYICKEYSYDTLDSLLFELSQGYLDIGGLKIFFSNPAHNPPHFHTHAISAQSVSKQYTTIGEVQVLEGKTVIVGTETIQTYYDLFDRELMSKNNPYMGLADFLKEHSWLADSPAPSDNPYVQVLAPTFLQIDKSNSYFDDELVLTLETQRKIQTDALAFGIVVRDGNRTIERKMLKADHFNIDETITGYRLSTEVPIGKEIDIILKLAGVPVDSISLKPASSISERAIYNTYKMIDSEFLSLKKLLNPQIKKTDRKAPDDFEAGVALLFSLAGLSVTPLGLLSLDSNIIDGIAFDHERKFALIYECTLGRPDTNDKLSKLAMRAKRISPWLDDFKWRTALVTALDEKSLPEGEKQRALQDDTLVIGKGQLEGILSMIAKRESVESITDYLQYRAPFGIAP